MEGLRPRLNDDGTMGFELQDGVFKKFVARARKNYENSQKSLRLNRSINGKIIRIGLRRKCFSKKRCDVFNFIVDEINRGEISKIFGELFFAIDPGYRGKSGEVSTQYSNLHSGLRRKCFSKKRCDVFNFIELFARFKHFSHFINIQTELVDMFKKFVARARKNYENSQKSQDVMEKEMSVQESMMAFFSGIELAAFSCSLIAVSFSAFSR